MRVRSFPTGWFATFWRNMADEQCQLTQQPFAYTPCATSYTSFTFERANVEFVCPCAQSQNTCCSLKIKSNTSGVTISGELQWLYYLDRCFHPIYTSCAYVKRKKKNVSQVHFLWMGERSLLNGNLGCAMMCNTKTTSLFFFSRLNSFPICLL